LGSDVENTGEVQTWPATAGVVADALVGGCVVDDVVDEVVDDVLVGGAVVDDDVLDEVVDVVVLVTGAVVLEEVAGCVVGDTGAQVTWIDVGLTLVQFRLRVSQLTGVVVPTGTVIAPTGTAAGRAGTTESKPDTAAHARNAVQVGGPVGAAEEGTIASPVRMSPFLRIRVSESATGSRRARRP
jgi:hypothetical protein